jgi:hypothetical protein
MLYLYLAKRNKSQIKILSVLRGGECPPIRVTDVKKLSLPLSLTAKLEKQIHEDRMQWEPWIESAESYTALAKSLQKRGFKSLPLCGSPMFEVELEKIITSEQERQKVTAKLDKPPQTMLRRKR